MSNGQIVSTWRGVLSLRDPAALSGRPGHPRVVLAAEMFHRSRSLAAKAESRTPAAELHFSAAPRIIAPANRIPRDVLRETDGSRLGRVFSENRNFAFISDCAEIPWLTSTNTPQQQREMLLAIGAKSVAELFEQIPAPLRMGRALDLPPALTELELESHLRDLAAKNDAARGRVCFLGGGAYDHSFPPRSTRSPRAANSTQPIPPTRPRPARGACRRSSNTRR